MERFKLSMLIKGGFTAEKIIGVLIFLSGMICVGLCVWSFVIDMGINNKMDGIKENMELRGTETWHGTLIMVPSFVITGYGVYIVSLRARGHNIDRKIQVSIIGAISVLSGIFVGGYLYLVVKDIINTNFKIFNDKFPGHEHEFDSLMRNKTEVLPMWAMIFGSIGSALTLISIPFVMKIINKIAVENNEKQKVFEKETEKKEKQAYWEKE